MIHCKVRWSNVVYIGIGGFTPQEVNPPGKLKNSYNHPRIDIIFQLTPTPSFWPLKNCIAHTGFIEYIKWQLVQRIRLLSFVHKSREGDKSYHYCSFLDIFTQVSAIRNALSHMKLMDKLHISNQTLLSNFQDIIDLVDCLQRLHPNHFTATVGSAIRSQLNDVSTCILNDVSTCILKACILIYLDFLSGEKKSMLYKA